MRKKHPSPNGGYAEATVAGAMHVQLAGITTMKGNRNSVNTWGMPRHP